jgi:cytochrome c oxidase assembly factor CtaG
MVQHILLIVVAAPLLVLGISPALPAWGLPRSWRRPVLQKVHSMRWVAAAGKLLQSPFAAWALHALALWIWHAPGLYQGALNSAGLHALEHLSFLGTALLFWWVLFRPAGERELGLGAGLLFIFTMALQSGLLGALLSFSPQPWYPAQSGGAAAWGLSPLEDQQLAGALMWVPAGVVYLVAALWLLGRRLLALEREDLASGWGLEKEL